MKKCERCENPATVHLIEIKGGQRIEKHLCEQHAMEEGVAVKVSQAPLAMPLNALLEKFVMKQAGAGAEQDEDLACPQCGMNFEEFRKGGLLGCPECYHTFESLLAPLLERAHEGATGHIGKIPSRAGVDDLRQQRLLRLRRELEDAVASEQYERAAWLRDQLNRSEAKS